MTPDQQRIAIAEACGAVWKRQSCSPWYPDDESRNVYFRRLYFIEPNDIRGPAVLPDAAGWEMVADDHSHLPNYFNDLNAMHEAEKTLIIGKTIHGFSATGIYTNVLSRISKSPIHAEAFERAEAVLRTIDKYTE